MAKTVDRAEQPGGIDDVIRFEGLGQFARTSLGVGAVAILASLALGWSQNDGLRAFLHSYVVAFMWALAAGLGALWFVTLQHLTSSDWSVVVRRVGELLAGAMPIFVVLALPLVVPMALGMASSTYVWLDHDAVAKDHLLHHKAPYLNLSFFLVRCVLYFGFWSWLGRYFLSKSLELDASGDASLLARMRAVSAPAMIALAVTLTFCAIDFLMTLDPSWFSTIFGVYYFAGAVMSGYSLLGLSLFWLQKNGCLKKIVKADHFHDIGKMMFAFGTVFWSYIAFSQFMLIWYADIPEETHWYHQRFQGEWAKMSWALAIGHLAIPFFGLLSRHVKRHRFGLGFFAVWLLGIEYLDMYWLVKPALGTRHVPLHLLDVTTAVGVAAVFLGFAAWQGKSVNLVPVKDPRLAQSLAFENY